VRGCANNIHFWKVTGFDAKLGGQQATETFFMMRVLFSVVPAELQGLVLLLLIKYPLTDARMQAIRTELQRRRASPAAAAPPV